MARERAYLRWIVTQNLALRDFILRLRRIQPFGNGEGDVDNVTASRCYIDGGQRGGIHAVDVMIDIYLGRLVE